MLGGVRIPFDRGLAGHSDADVVLHAVSDALLGAAGMGDIGEHFPDTDPIWKDVESARLVAEVVAMLAAQGWRPVNCDLTVHAQAPKLAAFKAEMRSSLSRLLALELTDVNVKAKTGEHVGPIGRGEAISCEAAVLIDRA
jgi:2-C-methyl-D-erythritol 2,4-cyclodiphosphate synthase